MRMARTELERLVVAVLPGVHHDLDAELVLLGAPDAPPELARLRGRPGVSGT
jgi:hypothetical protein